MRVYPMRDSGPYEEWYEIDLPVGTILHDGFGDDAVVVEIPDELWERYTTAKKEIEAIMDPEVFDETLH